MRKAEVFYRDTKAGLLTEDENGYQFCYDEAYLASKDAEPISITLPLTSKPYRSSNMFPFFDGLIPEGWLLDIAALRALPPIAAPPLPPPPKDLTSALLVKCKPAPEAPP